MPKPFFFEAKSDQEVDIHIYGVIGATNKSWDGEKRGTNNVAYTLVSLIKRLDKQYARINVHINSPGGSINDGLAIYNTLKSAKAEIHTYNSGLVASMASILMLAGLSHHPKTSLNHLHSAHTITLGNVKDHKASIKQLKTFENALQNAISDKTGMSIKDIQAKWFDGEEHFMTAEEANDEGLVDFLEEETIRPPAAKNKLENMSFDLVMNLYHDSVEEKTEESFFNKLKSKFNFQTKNNLNSGNMADTLKFKAKLTVLLALVGISEFILNVNNKIELDINDAFKINDSLSEKDVEIEALKQEKLALEEKAVQDKAKIEELQAKVDGTAGAGGINPKGGGDNSKGGDDTPVDELDEETSAKLAEYNKKQA